MFEEMVGSNGTRFVIAAGAVAIGLLCLVGVLWFLRNRPSSPFIRGGKNRQPRLAVLDAAAVDTRRRLVLVRRDDVEHLILIGGPTDVVIESRIARDEIAQSTDSAPQVAAVAVPQTSVRQSAERRLAPQPETRTEPQAAAVSAMGQVLYGDDTRPAVQPVQRSAQPAQARPASQTTAIPARRPVEGVASQQARAGAATPVTPAVSVASAKSPEDILDAARGRVLAASPSQAQRPTPEIEKAAAILPANTVAPRSSGVAPSAQKDPSTAEFERILDAQITGDLGKLTADDIRAAPQPRTATPVQGARQEPRLEAPVAVAGGRTEPSLEEEMNRMLNEIAVTRKD
ncbi:flagellar biosynthetic protein FliO [Pararhizobium gei]|uniref:flagellar biosynthetic protein FliO n=1 Tax=Pararhizobium gei TaxID=1395951 RepID=UPI0023DB56E2|nr:flagellar biosynthetic protein FliO [Rhizobium gei]